MKILVLNCGSSSIKYQFIAMGETPDVLAKGIVERIGLPDAIFNYQAKGGEKIQTIHEVPSHQEGVDLVLKALASPETGVIKELSEIKAVGHRVAHGGEFFPKSVVVGEKEEKQIEELFTLAPLHNPANLKGIECIKAVLPTVPQVAVFDTSFHQTMPAHAFTYAIPYEYYENHKVRRYGFHGTSHKFVAEKACKMLGLKFEDTKIITCHLGNGASICAIDKGKSVDTSMGLTPLEGLIMGTRCGDFEAGAVFFLQEKENLNIQQMNDVLNKKSGMAGVSGVSSDMRDLESAAAEGNKRAQLALDMFAYRVKKYVGAYAAAMGGADVIIFTGGIGENAYKTREYVCQNMEYMGVKLDEKINTDLRGKDTVISTADSRVKVLLLTTDEELVIATDTYNLCK